MAGLQHLKSFQDVRDLRLTELRKICRSVGLDTSYGRHALVNLLCHVLKISTTGSRKSSSAEPRPKNCATGLTSKQLREFASLDTVLLSGLSGWEKDLRIIPDTLDDGLVKKYLKDSDQISPEMNRSYKISRPYQLKAFVHSMKVHRLPDHPTFLAVQAQCNPSQSAQADDVKVIFVIMDAITAQPYGGYCTCTVGTSPSSSSEVLLETQYSSIRKSLSEISRRVVNNERKVDETLRNQGKILEKMNSILEFIETTESTKPKKTAVSTEIRAAVHDGYHDGVGLGYKWIIQEGQVMLKYDSTLNKEMCDHILQFVMGMYPNSSKGEILSGMKTYFATMKQKHIRKKTGKEDLHKIRQARYERKKRKTLKRKIAVESKTSWTPDQKKRVTAALVMPLMSSESERESDEGESHFVTRPLPWRSEELEKLIKEVDAKSAKSATKKGRHQTVKRVAGTTPSRRERPLLPQSLEWTLKND